MRSPQKPVKENLGRAANKRIGVIDIGSNSVRFVVYSVSGAAFAPIYTEKVLAGLGRDLQRTGKLSPEGPISALAALRRFALLVQGQKLDDLLIAATAALRDASDAPQFIAEVRTQTGLDISPLSGQEEAVMSANGVLAGEPRASGLAADLGGASLELVSIDQGEISGGVSYPLGPFAMYKGVFDAADLRPRIVAVLDKAPGPSVNPGQALYLIGGAWRNLASIHQKRTGYPLRLSHNYSLERADAEALARWASSPEGVEVLLNWPNMSKRRADTLPYSGLMLDILLDKLRPSRVIIAPGGLRDGMVLSALGDQQKNRDALFDACSSLAGHSRQNIKIAQAIDAFLSGLKDIFPRTFSRPAEARLRKAASLLISTGAGLHPDHRAQIIYEIALFGPLSGVTHKERAYLAFMVFRAFRSRKTPPQNSIIQHLLSEQEQNNARIYGEAIRAAVVLGGRSPDILAKITLSADEHCLVLRPRPEVRPLIVTRTQAHFQDLAKMLNLDLVVKT